jgi:hypothetical protein
MQNKHNPEQYKNIIQRFKYEIVLCNQMLLEKS